MIIKGIYGEAKVFTDNVEEGALQQIKEFLDQDYTKDKSVRIMPDVHQGIGCVIGLTAKLEDVVVPNLVGVDIGCGMLTIKLGENCPDPAELDRFIRKKIPSGTKTHRDPVKTMAELTGLRCFRELKGIDRIQRSIGTLGGGNHFIEVGKDSSGDHYLVIHSGSRNLGKQIAEIYQRLAVEVCGKAYPKQLCGLKGKYKGDYLNDMRLAQEYARINRETMGELIIKEFYNADLTFFEHFHTVHNYVDFRDDIIRKGAVSAYEGEKLLIPINMRDGSILAVGLGNPDWNISAPHGAGRLMSRRMARDEGAMDRFRESMKGIYSTSVHEGTIDESPFAYKPMEEILTRINETVKVVDRIIPVYNFKA